MPVIGVLTAGGDCPGLNAVIRGVVARADERDSEVLGIRNGWEGLMNGLTVSLDRDSVRGILTRGGTILGSSRTNPVKVDGGIEKIAANMEREGVDGLIAIGGEDTLGVAKSLHDAGVNVIGVPKTIDNDLGATDYTFGFDTAVNIAMEAIDRLHTTAESHHRVLIVEVMGRHAGWIAFHSGLAGGANVILIPEQDFDLDRVCGYIQKRFEDQYSPIIVVAEGAKPIGGFPDEDDSATDAFGHARLGGVAHWLEGQIEEKTGEEARATVLGHVQRGGTPTAFDRVLATRFGLHAIEAANEGNWGKMTALRSTEIDLVDLADAVAVLKTVPPELYEEAEVFFG